MDLPAFLTRHKYGEIRLTGHRIGLFHVVESYNEGMSAEQIAEYFPSLPLIREVLTFYQQKRAEVDAYVAACRAEIDRQAAETPPAPDLAEMRRRLEAKRQAEAKCVVTFE
jgi:uncharacterized protein (DUF433 family)